MRRISFPLTRVLFSVSPIALTFERDYKTITTDFDKCDYDAILLSKNIPLVNSAVANGNHVFKQIAGCKKEIDRLQREKKTDYLAIQVENSTSLTMFNEIYTEMKNGPYEKHIDILKKTFLKILDSIEKEN